MKWPGPRLTVRRLMIVVGVVALGLGLAIQVARLGRRARHYGSEAARAAFQELVAGQQLQMEAGLEKIHRDSLRLAREELAKPMYQRPEWKQWREGNDPLLANYLEKVARDAARRKASNEKAVAYWLARKLRYQQAARAPWLPPAPDPPEPR